MHAFALALLLAAPPEKGPSTLDEKIAAALKNHPDLKAAEAKKLLADAELEQAKLVITQKVSSAASRVELAKVKLIQAEEEVAIAEKMSKLPLSAISELERVQYLKAKPSLIAVKAELAAAELELQLLVGKGGVSESKAADKKETGTGEAPAVKMPTGAVVDKLELVVRRQVSLNLKDVTFVNALTSIASSNEAPEIIIRGGKEPMNSISVTQKAPISFEAALELLLDEHNAANVGKELNVYVREYGLLVEHPRGPVPKDAIPLTEFIKAVKAKKK